MNLIYFIIFILLFLFIFWDLIKIQILVFLIVKRGLITTNCIWWKISDFLIKDSSGINLFYELKKKYNNKIVPVYLGFNKMYLVTDMNSIKTILDTSPDIFGVGKLKYNMFKSFMEKNVGVSEGCPWRMRRQLNEDVLFPNKLHPYYNLYKSYISELFSEKIPTNFNEFLKHGIQLSSKIIFNDRISSDIYKIFNNANTIWSAYSDGITLNKKIYNKYISTLTNQIRNPKKNSLIELLVNTKIKNLDKICIESLSYLDYEKEMLDQIPHWMFPIPSAVAVSSLRVLLLLCNHPSKLLKAKNNKTYLRNCILETLRLNNPVVTMMRTLLTDFKFETGSFFKRGTQFLILTNPILRSPEFFKYPNKFYPERWNSELENSYYSIMFSQGPQKCPGKELAILIIQLVVSEYLNRVSYLYCKKINTNIIPQMIDACKINLTYRL